MSFFFLVLLPPILYAVSSILDKVLVDGDEDDAKTSVLLAIGGFFNFLIAIPILIFLIYKGGFVFSAPLFLNGIIFSIAIFLYLEVLRDNDVDRVIPWFQTIPIFGLFGGIIFLSEIPSILELIGIAIILIAGWAISKKSGGVDKKLIILMLLSSLLIAINDVIFAFFGREMTVSNALFSDIIGKGVVGLAFLLVPHSLRGFKLALKTKFGLQSVNEVIYALGDAALDIAKLYFPIVIVQAFTSTQPLFTSLGSYILKKIRPNIRFEEDVDHLLKYVGIILFVIGGVILSISIYNG